MAGSDGSQGPDALDVNGLKKGRYLLILEQAGNVYIPGNEDQSALPVVADKVRWPLKMEDGSETIPTDLKMVKAQVAVFDLAEKEAYEKGVKTADVSISGKRGRSIFFR